MPFEGVPTLRLLPKKSHRLRVGPPGIEWKTGRNPKMGKNWPKNRKWPSARNGEKMAQKWRKNRKMTPNPIFLPFLGHFFPISGRGPFLFFGQFFPIFGFRPVFHSIPGGLTRKPQTNLVCFCLTSRIARFGGKGSSKISFQGGADHEVHIVN